MNHFYDPNLIDNSRTEGVYIHESAYVDSPCQIGDNTSILHFTHVMANSIIGSHCQIGHNVTIASGVLIGNHVKVSNHTMLSSGSILEDDVYCGPSTIFSDLKHIRAQHSHVSPISPTIVRRGAHIGANTTIAAGFTIGSYTFIEAGSVIDRNIPDFALISGNPLRFGGWRCQCGEKLKFHSNEQTLCKSCGKAYLQKSERKIIPLRDGVRHVDSDSEFNPPIQSVKRQD